MGTFPCPFVSLPTALSLSRSPALLLPRSPALPLPRSLFSYPVSRINRPQDRAEIAFLLFERSHGDYYLGAGVIERHEQSPVPAQDFRRRVAQLVIMALDQFQRVERDRAERGDDRRIDQFDL